MMRSSLIALLVASFVGAATNAEAYTVIRRKNGNSTTWKSMPVKWTISTNTMSDMSTDAIEEAVQGAFDAWKDVNCSTITFSFKGYKNFDPQNGIHVTFKENSWDPAVGDALAYSVSESSGNGTISSNDVVVNAKDSKWSNSGAWGTNDLQGVLTHEIGHSIGLDHSREFTSTMFFSGGNLKLRTLEEDDEKGACFLYPSGAFTKGLPCDACDKSQECQYGYCWSVGGGHSYCGANCTNNGQCPSGFECATLDNSVEKQCWPTNGYCNQWGQNVGLGDFCFGHEVCESGICLVTGDSAFCSKQCTSSNQCGQDMSCSGGFCMPSGSSPYGAECQDDAECETALCIAFGFGGGVCTQTCGVNGGTCPPGNQCYDNKFCVPPGPSPNGTPCGLPNQCLGTYCIDNSCTQVCNASTPCPAGTSCVGGYCQGAATGGSCETAQTCPPGMICQSDGPGTTGSCEYDCNPLGGFGCPEGQVCKWRWESWTEQITGLCVPKNGGQTAGENCEDKPCENDLVCDSLFGSTPTCRKDCKSTSTNNLGCGVLETCVALNDPNDPLKGLCVGDNEGPPPEPEPDADAGVVESDAGSNPPPNDVGVTPELDSVSSDSTGSTTTQPGTKKESGEHSACGAGDSPRAPWLWASLLLILLLSRRRLSLSAPTDQS